MQSGFVKNQFARLKALHRFWARLGSSRGLALRLAQSSARDADAMSLRRLATTVVSHGRQWLNHVSAVRPALRFKPKSSRGAVGITTEVGGSSPPSSSSSSWTVLSGGQSLAGWTSQARAAFVNGLIRSAFSPEAAQQSGARLALSRELRRSVARRLLQTTEEQQQHHLAAGRRAPPCTHAPFLGLVGLGLASSESGIVWTEEEEYVGLCSKLRDVVARLSWVWDVNRPGVEVDKFRSGAVQLRASDLEVGPMLGKGANAAVHAADWIDPGRLFGGAGADAEPGPDTKRMRRGSATSGGSSFETPLSTLVSSSSSSARNRSRDRVYPLAVKVMFNYDVMSDVGVIMREMRKELVPCLSVCLQGNFAKESWVKAAGCLPPHPNVALCFQAFADRVSDLPGSMENYGLALPPRLNPDGLGRNMSLFLVMKRYDVPLDRYLAAAGDRLSHVARQSVLAQVLEGVAHLVSHGIAHRDLKTDNILVNFDDDGFRRPHVVISDFGCCLDDPSLNLKLPFTTEDTSRGGNTALMAPEVINAVPGLLTRIDYSKADVWAVGAISYEIFGDKNPFYDEPRLYSGSYKQEDLPPLSRVADEVLQRLVAAMLAVDPRKRISAAVAANVCQLLLWGPRSWVTGKADGENPSLPDIMSWILSLATKVIWEARGGDLESDNDARLEFQLASTFMSRMEFTEIKAAVDFICRG